MQRSPSVLDGGIRNICSHVEVRNLVPGACCSDADTTGSVIGFLAALCGSDALAMVLFVTSESREGSATAVRIHVPAYLKPTDSCVVKTTVFK